MTPLIDTIDMLTARVLQLEHEQELKYKKLKELEHRLLELQNKVVNIKVIEQAELANLAFKATIKPL